MKSEGNICGIQLKGKNPTNVKVQLGSSHREAGDSQKHSKPQCQHYFKAEQLHTN